MTIAWKKILKSASRIGLLAVAPCLMADQINLGLLWLLPSSSSTGTEIVVDNLTGVFAFAPDFLVGDAITFENAEISYTLLGGGTFILPQTDYGPGVAQSVAAFPSGDLIEDITFVAAYLGSASFTIGSVTYDVAPGAQIRNRPFSNSGVGPELDVFSVAELYVDATPQLGPVVPEPSTLSMLGVGFVACLWIYRRERA